jgi:hypothetical protein
MCSIVDVTLATGVNQSRYTSTTSRGCPTFSSNSAIAPFWALGHPPTQAPMIGCPSSRTSMPRGAAGVGVAVVVVLVFEPVFVVVPVFVAEPVVALDDVEVVLDVVGLDGAGGGGCGRSLGGGTSV